VILDQIVISFLLEEAFDRPGIEVEIRESTEPLDRESRVSSVWIVAP
jgi:hypothetical protein